MKAEMVSMFFSSIFALMFGGFGFMPIMPFGGHEDPCGM